MGKFIPSTSVVCFCFREGGSFSFVKCVERVLRKFNVYERDSEC